VPVMVRSVVFVTVFVRVGGWEAEEVMVEVMHEERLPTASDVVTEGEREAEEEDSGDPV
jgi:hypothetical protein